MATEPQQASPAAIPHRPTALMLAPEAPYPIVGGGALRTASLLEYLSRHYDVDLVVFRQPGAEDPATRIPPGKVRRVEVLELARNGRGLASRAVRNAGRLVRRVPPLVDRFSGFQDRLRDSLKGRHYDLAVIEHFWCASYWEPMAAVSKRIVLNLHNVESVLHHRCSEAEGPAAGFMHRVFEGACREMEREWLPRFSAVLTASESDAAAVKEISPETRVQVYPNSIPWRPLPQTDKQDVIVFSGNMEYHPNISAVRFFSREVWPILKSRWPELVWRLLGKNPGAVSQFTSGDPRIQVIGEMKDAVVELARCKVAVVPLLAGSGTRLKILEAWAAGTPVVSTSLGAEGLPACDGRHILLADGAASFADAVSRLLASQELGREIGMAGRLLLDKEFTWETAWKALDF